MGSNRTFDEDSIMRIIRPITITPALLTSSDIAETDEAEYSNATNYTAAQLVMVTGTGGGAATATHKIYKALAASGPATAVKDPTDQDNNADTWLEVSATNRWKMFDNRIGDQSVNATAITIEITLAEIANAAALFNLDAATLDVVVTSAADGEVYNETVDLADLTLITDFYSWFFEPIARVSEYVIFNLPNYNDATIAITLSVPSGSAGVGEIIVGRQRGLGYSVYGTSVSFLDYSTVETDIFGITYIQQRSFADRVNFDIRLPTNQIAGFKRTLAGFRATPIVWSAVDGSGDTFGALVFGIAKDPDVVISTPSISDCTVHIEGLS